MSINANEAASTAITAYPAHTTAYLETRNARVRGSYRRLGVNSIRYSLQLTGSSTQFH